MIDEVLSRAISLYGFSGQTKVLKKVSEGFLSQNYILGSGKPEYFLKEYRFQDFEKVKKIHKIKFHFSENEIPIILPLVNREGNTYFDRDGKFYAVFPFVTGMTISRESPPDKALISCARMLAKIHLLSKDKMSDLITDMVKGWDKLTFLSEAKDIKQKIEKISNKSDLDRKYLETLNIKIELANEDNSCYEDLGLRSDHLVHGDYHDKNLFFNQDFSIKYVFDLEKSEYSPRVLELIRSLDFLCLGNKFTDKNIARARLYFESYNNLYPISQIEFQNGLKAYYLKKIHSLWLEKEHYLNKNYRIDVFAGEETKMLNYFRNNFDDFIANFSF